MDEHNDYMKEIPRVIYGDLKRCENIIVLSARGNLFDIYIWIQ